MAFDLLITNGSVVAATDTYKADVAIQDGKITAIGASLPRENAAREDDATIFKAMRRTAKNGGMICMHAENGGAIDVIVQQALAEGKTAPKYHALTRPTTAEAEATSRAIALAEMAGSPVYIVHLSCNDALEKVREARDRGLPVYEQTCPQYLY